MKCSKYLMLATLLASLSFSSCDLERLPLTDLSEENFWNDEKNAELALTALYRGKITNGLEYSVSDFWSYHGLLFMEHLTDNAFDRRGENNDFYKISSGQLLNTNSFIRIIGRRLIHALVNAIVFWKECKKCQNQTRIKG